jgi:metallophosphoesterase superfamily enzyme
MLATDSDLRRVLYEAMLSQLIADVEAGVDSVKNQAGINFENGQVMERTGMFGAMISIEAQAILTNGDGKTNLLYPGDRGFRLADDKYTKWEY